jgi:hypothetical protein
MANSDVGMIAIAKPPDVADTGSSWYATRDLFVFSFRNYFLTLADMGMDHF